MSQFHDLLKKPPSMSDADYERVRLDAQTAFETREARVEWRMKNAPPPPPTKEVRFTCTQAQWEWLWQLMDEKLQHHRRYIKRARDYPSETIKSSLTMERHQGLIDGLEELMGIMFNEDNDFA